MKARRDRSWLLATAKTVAGSLKPHTDGTRLRIRIPTRATVTDTNGWGAAIGDLGKGQPLLEIWFCRFSGFPERKLYAGFFSERRQQLTSITKHVSGKLWPVREVNIRDLIHGRYVVLAKRLGRAEFNTPIVEKYANGETWYGIYDATRETSKGVSFCTRAVAFFEDVARTLPNANAEDEQREVYPRYENRKRVASHLKRERSRLLATERKILDGYQCQVCGLRFEDVYGKLGSEFAESHHLVPLSRMREGSRTNIDDLATVCANCHRMLHRMNAESAENMKRLSDIIRKRRGKRT